MLPPSGWQHSICPLGHLGYTFRPVCIVGMGPLNIPEGAEVPSPSGDDTTPAADTSGASEANIRQHAQVSDVVNVMCTTRQRLVLRFILMYIKTYHVLFAYRSFSTQPAETSTSVSGTRTRLTHEFFVELQVVQRSSPLRRSIVCISDVSTGWRLCGGARKVIV